MIIRTLRPCEVAGRTVRAGVTLDLIEGQANALIDAGDAEAVGAPPARVVPPASAGTLAAAPAPAADTADQE